MTGWAGKPNRVARFEHVDSVGHAEELTQPRLPGRRTT